MSAASKVWRVGRWFLIGVAGIALLLVLAVTLVMVTPAGARWAVSTGLARSPVPVTVASVEGTLRGPLVLEGIAVEKDGLTAEIDRAVLDWRPLRLLRKRVVIDSLHVEGLVGFVPAGWGSGRPPPEERPDSTAGPPRVPELPVDVEVRDLRVGIERVTLEDRAEIVGSSLRGHGTPDAFELGIEASGRADPVSEFGATASLEGTPEDWRIRGDLRFASGELPPVSGTLALAGSLTGLRVEEANLRTASGRADLAATVDWYPAVAWSLEADADGLDVAPFTPAPQDWPGTISFRARSEGRLEEAGPTATVSVDGIDGELRGQPLAGGLDLRVAPGRAEIDTLGLAWGSARVAASGALLEELDLTFALDVPDLGTAIPAAAGSVRAEGTVSGTRDAPRLEAELAASEIRTETAGIGSARGRLALDLAPGASSAVDLRAERLSAGARSVDSLLVEGEGTREAHALGLRAYAAEGRLALGVSGAVSGPSGPSGSGARSTPSWDGSIDSLVAFAEAAGEWRLREPAALRAGPDAVGVETACLARDAAEVCLEGSWERAGPAEGEFRIAALPLELAQSSLPETIALEGRLDGEGRVAVAPGGALSGDGALAADGTLAATVGAAERRFRLGGEGARFRIDESGASAALVVALTPEAGAGDLRVEGRVALPGYTTTSIPLEEQAIEGRLEVRSDDLGFLAAFSPRVEDAGGRLQLESAIAGTAAAPEVRGSLSVEDGRFDLPELGLELRELRLTASGDPDGGVELEGSVTSGEGRLELAGRTPVEPSPESPAELTLRGERFRAMDTPEIQVEVAPDLSVSYDGTLASVEGRVGVPWARIELVEAPPSAVSPSPDVVFVDEEAPPPPEVDARVEVEIGPDVHFDGFGFSSGIEGELRVRQEPGQPPNVLGELRFVDGRYAAYGQNLVIDPGRVVFSGPVADASLDVTALRTASDGTVAGFLVRGAMTDPEIGITSDPAMSDADALSYIMYGKDMGAGDPSQQEQVAGAVAALGANVVTTKLAGKIGLDEARIEGATKEQAELVAGKYLSPSLYVSYGLGLFKPSNTFRIKYLLSSHWAVQAESGDANGGDVLYQIERGR